MDQTLLAYAVEDVPRYTSYPTAAQFRDGLTPDSWRPWVAGFDTAKGLSIYAHVPFCETLCWYCGCHTNVLNDNARIARYAELLTREVALAASETGYRGAGHVHFGGGTPTLLPPAAFARFIAEVDKHFGLTVDAEIAVEADPRTLTHASIAALTAAGVNRMSLGVQDFDAKVQAAINRIQPFDVVDRVVTQLRRAGVKGLNLDLMYGLPHQTVESVSRTARLAAALAPDRLSVFGYAHVPWFKAHQRQIDEGALPGAAERLAQAEAIEAVLAEEGFEAIGIDHFARAGDPMALALRDGTLKRNFQGYTTDKAKVLIGLGASSIGRLPGGFVQNERAAGKWAERVEAGEWPIIRGLEVTAEDAMRAEIIERIMCFGDCDVADVLARHGLPAGTLNEAFASLVRPMRDGLCTVRGPRVRLTMRGRRFARTIAAAFDASRNAAGRRHSVAV